VDTCLITGFNGFLGSHLVPLLQKNYQVIGISNSKSLIPISQIRKNIIKITCNDLPKKISIIFHLAAISDVDYCQQHPSDVSLINIHGTQNILEIARQKDAKLVFLSTGHVYGNAKKLPISENHIKKPISIYAATKLAGEALCESYSNSYGIDISIARLFSVYGPNAPKHSVTNNIISQILTKNRVKLGNIKTKRDFLYVTDAVSAINLIGKKIDGFNDYNIGSGKSYSIQKIFKLLKTASGIKVPLESVKTKIRDNDSLNLISNSNKIKQLGWRPIVSLENGIDMTFNWYKNNSNA